MKKKHKRNSVYNKSMEYKLHHTSEKKNKNEKFSQNQFAMLYSDTK